MYLIWNHKYLMNYNLVHVRVLFLSFSQSKTNQKHLKSTTAKCNPKQFALTILHPFIT